MVDRSSPQSSPLPQPVTLGLAPSFGFGDRLGLATPGHVEAMRRAGAGLAAIFPQQSIREMTRTGRTAEQVMRDALDGAHQAGWTDPIGADADHLKTQQDVDVTAAAGFTFFTLDPSDHVDPHADHYNESELRARFATIQGEIDWFDHYRGKTIRLPQGNRIELNEQACMRAAVKYGRALNHAQRLSHYVQQVQQDSGRDFEIELSIDETDQPTSLAEHFIIADQCLDGGMKLVSLAPRLVGDFEKGIDYRGDLQLLERSLQEHAAIARLLGPYKLSLHSGSDKLSMYPALARATQGRFHVKTAGTSYLEALRVVAHHDQQLLRQLIDFARERYPADKASYHVSATLAAVPPCDALQDPIELERHYLERWCEVPAGRGFTRPGRQILHCTFGSILTHPQLGAALRQVLYDHLDTYTEVLADHFARHLQALCAGM